MSDESIKDSLDSLNKKQIPINIQTPLPEPDPSIETGIGNESTESDLGNVQDKNNKSSNESKKYLQLRYWYDWRRSIFQGIGNYMRRVFSFPLVNEPISFSRPGDFISNANLNPSQNKDLTSTTKLNSNEVEDICNYDKATKELFELILQERKEIMNAKDKYHYQEIDISKFPSWNETVIERLKSTFQVFDVTGDGLIDFEEMSSVLTEFGDKTSEDIRKRYFNAVDIDESGAIDFEEFVTMTYNLTMQKDEGIDPETVQFGESYRMIDRNMSRIRSLDVVQQLQAGLF